MLDHEQSHRIGQRPTTGSTGILKVATNADRPENPYEGLVVYVEETDRSWIWDTTGDEWLLFGGGLEFYAQDDEPTSAGYAAFWLDTAP